MVYMCQVVLTYLSADKRRDWFPFLAIVSTAAIHTSVQAALWWPMEFFGVPGTV